MLVYIHLPFHLDGLLDNSKSNPDSQFCIIMHAYNVRCIICQLPQSNHRLCVTLHTFVCKNTKIKHTISLFDNKYGKIFAFMSFSSIKSEKKKEIQSNTLLSIIPLPTKPSQLCRNVHST